MKEVSNPPRDLSRRINSNLDIEKINLSFLGKGTAFFQFIQWVKLLNQKHFKYANLCGRCNRIDEKGLRCQKVNNNHDMFSYHDGMHDKLYPCSEANCHMVYSAFDYTDPKDRLDKHIQAHDNDKQSKIRGSTKKDLPFPCRIMNPANHKPCGYSFSRETHRNQHEKCHREEVSEVLVSIYRN